MLHVSQTTGKGREGQTPQRKAKTAQNIWSLEGELSVLLVTMHGPHPTIKDIELSLAPEDVPALCNVQLDEDEYINAVEPAQQAYCVVTVCPKCSSQLRLVVECSHADIRAFEQLLLGTLTVVCPRCV